MKCASTSTRNRYGIFLIFVLQLFSTGLWAADTTTIAPTTVAPTTRAPTTTVAPIAGTDTATPVATNPVTAAPTVTEHVTTAPCVNGTASDGSTCTVVDDGHHVKDKCAHEEHTPSIHLASFRWDEIGVFFTITAFIIIAGFAKLGFHKLEWLSSKVPESCLLVMLGLAVSLLVYFTTDSENPNKFEITPDPCHRGFQFPQFSSEVFFLILLPPIILDSAYSLYDRVFLDNLGTVLLFAVIGTLFNVFAIGLSLYGIYMVNLIPNMTITLTDALVFASLISAVDPVAVLAIFQELGVNQNLYFLIFGESLLNDGVTVVVYNTMSTFRQMETIPIGQVALAVLSFFITTFGGVFIGIFYGILTAIMTKWTNNVRVMEPLALLGLAYLSYLTAELFHFSGIICLIVCGLIQAHFGFYNISQKSYICVKYFTKMASATSDTVIFMFLGMLLVNENHEWNTAFVIWSLVFCFVYRFIAVFVLSFITNFYRTKALGFEEQFIAAYGGLRGAVAFSLVSTLEEDMPERNIYIFTTLIVILFTIFVQGITIKPLVGLLKIKKKSDEKKNLTEEITETGMDHLMAGIEEILGHHGDFYLRELLMHYNDKYLKKWFMHEDSDTKLTRLFEKICLSEHYAHLYGPIALVEEDVKPIMPYPVNDKSLVSSVDPLLASRMSITRDEIYGLSHDDKQKSIDSYIQNGRQTSRTSMPDVDELESVEVLPPETHPNQRRRRKSFKRRTVAEAPSVDEDEGLVLRKALRDNRYNKLHYKYNRNLVDEENQEISEHLNRRSYNAQRMSAIASATYFRNNSSNRSSEEFAIRNRSKSVKFEALAKSLVLVERHRRRTMSQRTRNLKRNPSSPSNKSDKSASDDLIANLLEAQEKHIRELDDVDDETTSRCRNKRQFSQSAKFDTSRHAEVDRQGSLQNIDQSLLRHPKRWSRQASAPPGGSRSPPSSFQARSQRPLRPPLERGQCAEEPEEIALKQLETSEDSISKEKET